MSGPSTNELGDKLVGPIKMSKSISAGGVILVILGIGALLLASFLAVKKETAPAVFLGVLAAIMFIPGLVLIMLRKMAAKQLTVFSDGIQIGSGGVMTNLLYEQLNGYNVLFHEILNNGHYGGATVTCSFWHKQPISGKPDIECVGVFKTSNPEHEKLGQALGEIREGMALVFEERLKRGETIKGRGIEMTQNEVRFGHESIPMEKLARIANFERKVSYYRKGDAMPCHSFPETDPNQLLIMALVNKILESADDDDEDVGGLGRVLMNKQGNPVVGIVVGVLGALAVLAGLIVGTGLFNLLMGQKITSDFVIGGLVTLGVGAIMIPIGIGIYRNFFRCHERGVSQRNLFGATELEYTEIEKFTYSATMNYVNGSYTGTTLVMTFAPDPGVNKKPVNYMSTSMQDSEDDLNALRDHISGIIAARMIADLEIGHEVPWGNDSRLTSDGIMHTPKGLFGKKAAVLIPWDEIADYSLFQGVLTISHTCAEAGKAIKVSCAEPNFFPGFIAFLTTHEPEEDATAPAEA